MIWVIVIIGVLVAAVIAFYWWGMRPGVNDLDSPEKLPIMLRYLVNQGVDGASVRVQVRDDTSRQLTFVKYVRAQNDVGFRSLFLESTDDAAAFEQFREELTSRGIKYDEVSGEGGNRGLSIDYVHDLGLAHLVLRLLFERVWHVRIEKECVGYIKDVLFEPSPKLTGVDKPVV
jgi:hypothetical protein